MITIDENELTSDHITKHCENFMERVEAKIGNTKQHLFDGTNPDRLYCSDFGDTGDDDANMLHYGEEIQY